MHYVLFGLELQPGNVHFARSIEDCQVAADVHFGDLFNQAGVEERRALAIYRYQFRQPDEDDMLELCNSLDECGNTTVLQLMTERTMVAVAV